MKRIKDMSIVEIETSLSAWQRIKKFYLLVGGLLSGVLMIKLIFDGLDIYDIAFILASINILYIPIIIEMSIKTTLNKKRKLYALKQYTK